MILLRAVLWALFPLVAFAQTVPRGMDAQIMREARLVASAGRVDVYAHATPVEAGLAAVADQAIRHMERILGRELDTAAVGERVAVYVSGSTRVSHVLGGYDHPRNPQAILFLNPFVAKAALTGHNATYAHELAHLLTWRFYSHTLREGLADYLALALHPGSAVGPNREGHSATAQAVPEEVRTLLGSTEPPPSFVLDDPVMRGAYYAASYRLVRHLIALKGLPVFMQLYGAQAPLPAYKALYGKERQELVLEALGAE